MSINQVTIVGRLGNDPERRGDNGPTRLSVATDRRVKKGDDWESVTDWHSVVVWGKQGDLCRERLTKGSTVAVSGRLETRSFEGREGEKKSVTEVVAEHVTFCDPKRSGGGRDDDRGRDDRDDRRGRDDDRRGDSRDTRGRDDRDSRGGASKGRDDRDRRGRDDDDDRGRSKGRKDDPKDEKFDDDIPF